MSTHYALFKNGEMVKEVSPSMWPGDVAIKASAIGCKPIDNDMKEWVMKDISDMMFISYPNRLKRYRTRVNNIVDEYGLIDFDEGYIIKAVYTGTEEETS